MRKAETGEKLPKKKQTTAEMMQSNWAAQMEGLGYDASGMSLAGNRQNLAEVSDKLPKEAQKIRTKDAGAKNKSAKKRAKARKPNEKLTPASIFRKIMAFGKDYQIENEQDFQEAARIYAEEAALIDQMRDRLDADGLTVMKTYKTGDVEVAHPLLSELPRHVESANKCLLTIGNMIENRGAKKTKPVRELDQFRLHA